MLGSHGRQIANNWPSIWSWLRHWVSHEVPTYSIFQFIGQMLDHISRGRHVNGGGENVEWLVSRTTFSGHLRANSIRMVALPMIAGRSGSRSGSSGNDQPASSRRTASVLPQTPKYLPTGNVVSSGNPSDLDRPMTAMLSHTHAVQRIHRLPHRAAEATVIRGSSHSSSPRRVLPGCASR
jgi:hypothetical protein